MGISSLRDLLSGSANRAGIRTSVTAAMIVECANKMLPTYLAGDRVDDARAVSFKDGVLKIQVRSAAARFSLRSHEIDLVRKLNEEFPHESVTRIRTFISRNPIRYEFS